MSELAAPCPVCGVVSSHAWAHAKDLEYFSSSDEFVYLRCAACDVLFINPVPSDRLSEIYPANYYSFKGESTSVLFRLKSWLDRRGIAKMLHAVKGDSLRVLDVGGGTGWFLQQAKRADSRVAFTQVVDIDASAAKIARAAGHEFFQGTIEQFSSPQRFDLILMLNIIEHVADPASVLRTVSELLAPGGAVIVQTPNFRALDARIFRNRNWAGYHCPRHWVLFTRRSFERLADRCGLRVRSAKSVQGAAFWAVSVIIALHRRGLVRLAARKPAVEHWLFPLLAAVFVGVDLLRMPFASTSQIGFVLGAHDER